MKQIRLKLVISLCSLLLTLVGVELVARLLLRPSEISYGSLLGHELPPFRLIPASPPPETDRARRFQDLVVDGKRITVGDLDGAYRKDARIGYVPLESWSSAHGWWTNNNLGARSKHDVDAPRSEGTERLIVFGESFCAGFAVPQEDVWSHLLEREIEGTRLVNLCVPGYGMGQSFLRFQQIRAELEYDGALLVFVPGVDLWRDINVLRDVGEEGWRAYDVVPRFVLENGELRLVPSPYRSSDELLADNRHGASEKLRSHVREFDRFYFPAKFEESGVLDRSILYKLGIKLRYDRMRSGMHRSIVRRDSEAFLVSKAIFQRMDEQVREDGATFLLVVLPSHGDLHLLRSDEAYAIAWQGMIDSLSDGTLAVVDLTEDLLRAPEQHVDHGYDGSHYGPRANRVIAAGVRRELSLRGIPSAVAR